MAGYSVGVVYGCRFSEKQGKLLWDHREEFGGLVGQYEDQDKHAHPAWTLAADKSFSVVGYWTHDTVEDTEHLPCRLVEYAEMLKTYADSERGHEAIERWARFAERMRERGVKLDDPSFWVVERRQIVVRLQPRPVRATSPALWEAAINTSTLGLFIAALDARQSTSRWLFALVIMAVLTFCARKLATHSKVAR